MAQTTNPINSLTSNQYYRGLNARFDKRVAVLRKLGASYADGVWTSPRGITKDERVSSGVVMHADTRHWRDVILPAFENAWRTTNGWRR